MSEAPQYCPSKDCRASLRDPSVPRRFRKYRRLFTRALIDLEAKVIPGQTGWRCPECDHRWHGAGNFLEGFGGKTIG